MKKLFFLVILHAVLIASSFPQVLNPVNWEVSFERKSNREVNLVFNAKIDKGWHLYGLNMPEAGPSATTFNLEENRFEVTGKPVAITQPVSKYDSILELQVELLEGTGKFTQKIKLLTDNEVTVKGMIEYMACNDNTCTPPLEKEFELIIPASETASVGSTNDQPVQTTIVINDTLPENNRDTLTAITPAEAATNSTAENPEEKRGMLGILFVSLLAGLGALLTPCVYPMIPMTVSYFMRGTKTRGKAIAEASVYGFSIILIYSLLGVLVAIFKDPNAVNTVTTHWALNLTFFIVFIILAASFFGMFELVLPAGLANKIDQQADRGGYAGAFFMALGMTILSFSCTGPIVASLLIKASQGEVLEPVVGMFGFGLVFAIPFTLFAIFPSWLKSLPKSGSWLNAVKVFIAFILLAFSFYFLSKIDQAYHLNLLTREFFIGFWIVVFSMLGFYLLGKIRLPHDSPLESVKVPRFLLAVVVFTFVLYMVPGLFGKELQMIDTLLPPRQNDPEVVASSASLSENKNNQLCSTPKYSDILHLPHNLTGYFDYDEALACAKEKNKPVFVDFAGHGCANCKKMYQKVWSDPRVLDILKNDYIIAALYTDDKTRLSDAEIYTSPADGKVKNTIGKKNVDLQLSKFNSNALPLYAIIDPQGNVLTNDPYYVYNPDVEEFLTFLNEGLKNSIVSN